jgi:sodium/pantothenate symporter
MRVEHWVVLAYLAACIGIGVLLSRRVLTSRDEYWVAGRRVGTWVNALAIMATLASGGSIIGVMGLAYGRGIPYTLALFAGAVVGFPLASIRWRGRCAPSGASPSPTSSPGATRTR